MMYSIKNKKTAKGFTLIELLVVIAIIGVLATVVLASLNNARRKSRDARRLTDIKQIQLALELYFDSSLGSDQYPLGTGTCNTASPPLSYGLEVLAPTFISSVPRDPTSTTICYRYASIANSTSNLRTYYHLAAILEDSTNNAFNTDHDCDHSGADGCLAGTSAGVGIAIQGNMSSNCVLAAGAADYCYDVTP